jgi:hypothetical protein
MNSEEKLMARKVEQSNNVVYTKTQGNKYARVGSGDERKKSIKSGLKKNTSNLLKSNASGTSNNDNEKSNDHYRQFFMNKNLSSRGSRK